MSNLELHVKLLGSVDNRMMVLMELRFRGSAHVAISAEIVFFFWFCIYIYII